MMRSIRPLPVLLLDGFDTTARYCEVNASSTGPLGIGKAFRKGRSAAVVDCLVTTFGTLAMTE